MTEPTNEEWKRKIRELELWHRIGRASRRAQDGESARGPETIKAAAGLNLTVSNLRIARKFADPAKGYSPQELREVVLLCRAHRQAWGIAHLILILTVPRMDRRQLQRRAIAEGWSYSELRAELRKRFGLRRASGRRPAVPHDQSGLLSHLVATCDSWRRLSAELSRENDSGHVALSELPAEVRERLAKATRVMAKLHEVATEYLERRRPRQAT